MEIHNCSSYFCNRECEYFPCHKAADVENFNCIFCYCPLYHLNGRCGGNFKFTENDVMDCSECLIPHSKHGYEYITRRLKESLEK